MVYFVTSFHKELRININKLIRDLQINPLQHSQLNTTNMKQNQLFQHCFYFLIKISIFQNKLYGCQFIFLTIKNDTKADTWKSQILNKHKCEMNKIICRKVFNISNEWKWTVVMLHHQYINNCENKLCNIKCSTMKWFSCKGRHHHHPGSSLLQNHPD